MPIQQIEKYGLISPQIICHICKKPIQIYNGLVTWNPKNKNGTPPRFLHKGECDKVNSANNNSNSLFPREEIATWLIYLLDSAGITKENLNKIWDNQLSS